MKYSAIGMIEVSSIANGFNCEDAMLKAADVTLILARTICSGKYIVVVAGDVGAVKASVDAGKAVAFGELIDDLVIPNVDPAVFPALTGTAPYPGANDYALGILESFSATSILEAADAAVKAADILLFRVHIAMAIGGKGYTLLCGDVAAVQAALAAGAAVIAARGLLVGKVLIPRPRPELFQDVI